MLKTDAVALDRAAPQTPDNPMRLTQSGADDDDDAIPMSKRQAAIVAAKLRHPAGKAIPPSLEVRRWAEAESRDRLPGR